MSVQMEELKGKSREERMAYFNSHKSELLDSALEEVNGGAAASARFENPNSSCPYKGRWYTSMGWVCGNTHC